MPEEERTLLTAPVLKRVFQTALKAGVLAVALDAARTHLAKEVGRRAIADLVDVRMDFVPFGTGAFLTAAKVAWWVYVDPVLTVSCALRAEDVGLWRECARIWYLMKDDSAHGAHARREMARAAHECVSRLVRDGEFSEASFVVEPFLTSLEEMCAAYRELYNIFLEIGEPLEAAMLARRIPESQRRAVERARRARKPTPHAANDFTREDVRRAAAAAYRKALAEGTGRIQPATAEDEAFTEDDDPRTDAELIREQFGLTEEDLTA